MPVSGNTPRSRLPPLVSADGDDHRHPIGPIYVRGELSDRHRTESHTDSLARRPIEDHQAGLICGGDGGGHGRPVHSDPPGVLHIRGHHTRWRNIELGATRGRALHGGHGEGPGLRRAGHRDGDGGASRSRHGTHGPGKGDAIIDEGRVVLCPSQGDGGAVAPHGRAEAGEHRRAAPDREGGRAGRRIRSHGDADGAGGGAAWDGGGQHRR